MRKILSKLHLWHVSVVWDVFTQPVTIMVMVKKLPTFFKDSIIKTIFTKKKLQSCRKAIRVKTVRLMICRWKLTNYRIDHTICLPFRMARLGNHRSLYLLKNWKLYVSELLIKMPAIVWCWGGVSRIFWINVTEGTKLTVGVRWVGVFFVGLPRCFLFIICHSTMAICRYCWKIIVHWNLIQVKTS